MTDWITLAEAARRTGASKRTLQRMAAAGAVEARPRGTALTVDPETIGDLIARWTAAGVQRRGWRLDPTAPYHGWRAKHSRKHKEATT